MKDISGGVSAVGFNQLASKPTMNPPATWTGRRHLLDVKSLSRAQVEDLLAVARWFRTALDKNPAPLDLCKQHTVATVFYENSTRTRSSFELAGKRLGATVLNLDTANSSISKGETLVDTARALAAMGVNVIVQRHSASGSAHQLVEILGDLVGVVNAGDGSNEHPTQALLDLMTMSDVLPDIGSAKVAIIGDILHSRVARSNIWLLKKFGADVHVVGPPTLLPAGLTEYGVTAHTALEPAIKDANFIIVLRLQLERQQQGLIPSFGEYQRLYRLDHSRLNLAAPNVRILDPGPVNRDLQITNALADDRTYSLIYTQVRNGVFVRMAVLHTLLSQVGLSQMGNVI